MPEPIYQADPAEYLDRQRRMLRARGKVDGRMDPAAIAAILREVPPIAMRVGRRYRFRVLGGAPVAAELHGVEVGTGREIRAPSVEVPEPEWIEAVGLYLGRGVGPWAHSHVFRLDDANLAALADMDILRLEDADHG